MTTRTLARMLHAYLTYRPGSRDVTLDGTGRVHVTIDGVRYQIAITEVEQ